MAIRTKNIDWQVKDSNETDGVVIIHPATDADVVNFTAPSGMSSNNVQVAIEEVYGALPNALTNAEIDALLDEALNINYFEANLGSLSD